MPEPVGAPAPLLLRGPGGRPLRVAHLTTVDMSLALLLGTELRADVSWGLDTYGISAPGPYVAEVEALGVTYVPLPALTRAWDLPRDARAARQLSLVLRDLDLDVLHTHNPKTGVMGRVLGRLARVPVVVNTCHGLWTSPTDTRFRRAAVITAEGVAAKFSHFELYQNAEDRCALRRWVPRSRSQVVGNGIDLVRFVPDPAARERARSRLGIGPRDLLVGGVGRLVAEKGVREFVEAAESLGGRAHFVWAGPPDTDKADAVSDRPAHVRFLGARADMPEFYAALDIFVLPSHREGFSRSAMEAAACGTPMVLSDIRGCREIGVDGHDLLLVPPQSSARLAEAIGQLLDDAHLRARFARRARTRALTEFDQLRVARASLDTYWAVANRRNLGWQLAGIPA